MMHAALIFAVPVLSIVYLCLAIKVGFIVGDKTEATGFGAGFYLITVTTMLAMPAAIASLFF